MCSAHGSVALILADPVTYRYANQDDETDKEKPIIRTTTAALLSVRTRPLILRLDMSDLVAGHFYTSLCHPFLLICGDTSLADPKSRRS
jgi:hypothetical protein